MLTVSVLIVMALVVVLVTINSVFGGAQSGESVVSVVVYLVTVLDGGLWYCRC